MNFQKEKLTTFISSLLLVIVIAFAIIHHSSNDVAERFINSNTNDEVGNTDFSQHKQQVEIWRKKLGIDLPIFYFSVESLAEKNEFNPSDAIDLKYWIPVIRFHTDNQFHRWLFGDDVFSRGLVRGDFGSSYVTRQPVTELIKGRIGWSIGLTLLAILLSFIISIPLSFRAALNSGSRFDQLLKSSSLLLISLPVFWLGLLLLLLFANPDCLNWLPASGVAPISESYSGFLENIISTIPYLILPTLCYMVSTMSFLLISIRDSAFEELQTDYVRTALAKGQKESTVLYTHVFRNLLPTLLTFFSYAFPAAISGSVLIESIFGIPGMGLTIEQAVYGKDYPVLSAVFLISSLITLLGFLITDLIIARLDPRTTVKISA